MNIEDQVCSLELAKRLKELGVNQESYFSWIKLTGEYEIWPTHALNNRECAAFTVAELGKLLPDCIYATTASGHDKPIFMNKVDGIYSVGMVNANRIIFPRFVNTKEADARAEMLCYLLESGLIELPK